MQSDAPQDLAETIRSRISDRLHWLNLTAITAATKAGLPRDAIRNLFRRDAALPRADTLAAIAHALDTSVAFLIGETINPGVERWADKGSLEEAVRVARPIPIRAELKDGSRDWLAEPMGYVDLNVDGFETADLSAFVVADDAMDHYYEEGRLLIAAPVAQVGLAFGDHVIVLVLDNDDRPETLVREFAPGEDGPELVSHSTTPRRPLHIRPEKHDPRLKLGGVVVADFMVHARTPVPVSYVWGTADD